jgi:AGZA family xanthine/uracil permease-like MFS transporter
LTAASWIERRFGVRARGSTPAREVTAGLTTFATLSYILFVQPALLSDPACGMDAGGVLFATCVASALACFLMAWWANLPIALAPAMGHNFFFVYALCLGRGFRWQEALAANLIAGVVFLVLASVRFRERLMHALPDHLKYSIAAGIGLMIALVGLEWGGLVRSDPVTIIALGDLSSPIALLTLFGLALHAVLLTRRVTGSFLVGILGTALVGWGVTRLLTPETPLVRFGGLVGAPPSPAATAGRLDFPELFARPPLEWLAVIGVFLLLDLFDSVGTLVGVGERAGLLVDGKLPQAERALAADAAGTVAGSALGTSTITSYVESAAGVAAGGRTGLTAVTVGCCFLLALVFRPLFEVVGAGVPLADGTLRYPVIAPVLVLIGALMFGALRRIEWERPADAVPAFLTVLVMQVSFSITEGIAWGFLATSLLGVMAPRARRVPLWVHLVAAVFALRYVLSA